MITYKPIVIPGNKRKDGTYPVVIRITYKGKVRRLATTLVCTPGDLTRSLKIKSSTILSRADELINQIRLITQDLSPFDLYNKDVDWVVQFIKDSFNQDSFRLDFFEWCEEYMLSKSPSTRRAYSCALNTLERYLGKRTLDINDISRQMLIGFMEMVDKEPKLHWDSKTKSVVESSSTKIPKGASSRHLAKLEHMFNAAKDKFNDEDSNNILIPKSPFSKITKTYPTSNGQSNLGKELMQRIISYTTEDSVMRAALDIFIVSFGLMGANMADLYYAKGVGKQWVYNRQKTSSRRADKAEMRVNVPSCLKPFLERLKGQGEYWLNGLHAFASNKDFASKRVNRMLKRWCEEQGVDVFTFYSARHTWASLCRNECGVDKSTIDDCLGHKGSYQIADIYAEKAWGLVQAANKMVLDLFEWPTRV